MSYNYVGQSFDNITAQFQPRFLYALRRTDAGDLYFARVDQLQNTDSITINNPGATSENYDNFELGADFFEGRDVAHNMAYANLNYEQWRWDQRLVWYYLDNNGNLVARVGQSYTYPS